jgi:hypothetical protein
VQQLLVPQSPKGQHVPSGQIGQSQTLLATSTVPVVANTAAPIIIIFFIILKI